MLSVLQIGAPLRGAFVGSLMLWWASAATAAVGADAAATQPGELSKEQKRQLAALRSQATGRDFGKTVEAIEK
ncbi:MAG: hypothetical protein WBF17_23715, partial [Phycisphaerae bacterium]